MKFIKLWLPVVVWCYVIYFFSGIPGLATPFGVWDIVLRKCAHITEYFVLTFLLIRAFRKSFRISSGLMILCVSVVSFLYACSDEYHQTFVAHRSGTFRDVIIDSAGILIAAYIYSKKRNYKGN